MITYQRVSELLSYDPETGQLVWISRPARCAIVGSVVGTKTKNGYLRLQIDGKAYLAHRLIWLLVHGVFPDDQIDHINGDRVDNRLINLRSVSRSENGRNKKRPSHNTSGVVGVSRNKKLGKWQACITVEKEVKYLGVFKTIAEAAAVRALAEERYGFHKNHGRR